MHFTNHTPGLELLTETQSCFDGHSTGCASSPCCCLTDGPWGNNFNPCIFWGQGVMFCFALLSSLILSGFGISCPANLFPPTQGRYPQNGDPSTSGAPMCYCTATQRVKPLQVLSLIPSFVASKQQTTTSPAPAVCNLTPSAHPSPRSMDSPDQVSPGPMDESGEVMPSPMQSTQNTSVTTTTL